MDTAAGDATASAARGATYLMALQMSSRAMTFILNQVLIRFLTPTVLGRAVRLELYTISVIFFARESLRVALQRINNPATNHKVTPKHSTNGNGNGNVQPSGISKRQKIQAVVNLSYMSLLLGTPLAIVLGIICYSSLRTTSATSSGTSQNGDGLAVLAFGVASLLELASEPSFAAAQALMLFKVRAGAEATATVAKTVATVSSALLGHHLGTTIDVLPFAIGQLAFASTLLIFYTTRMGKSSKTEQFSLVPTKVADSDDYIQGLFSRRLLVLASSLFVQSGIKYVLTQGDSILIAALASLQEQGTYALAANYGGLIARMLFQPIEEASRSLFAKLCGSDQSEWKATKTTGSSEEVKTKSGTVKAADLLSTILHIYSLLGLFAFALGSSLAPLLLSLVAGQRWIELGAGKVLGTYTYYIPLLAMNGVTEAFVAAVADNKQLYQQSLWMGLSFIAFAGSAWWTIARMNIGAEGIIYANCVNMAARIFYCLWFIGRYMRQRNVEFDLTKVLPHGLSIAAATSIPFLRGAVGGMLSQYGVIGDLAREAGIAAVLVIAVALAEIGFLKHTYRLIRP